MKSSWFGFYIVCVLIMVGCTNGGQTSNSTNNVAAGLTLKLNPRTVLVNDSATATVTLESSAQISTPISVTIDGGDKATVSPGYTCQLTTNNPTCTATVTAGSKAGFSIVSAKAVGFPTASSTLNILTTPVPGTLSITANPTLALFNEGVTATITLNDSVGVKTPVSIKVDGGNNATVAPDYTCQLTSTNSTCEVLVKAGSSAGDSIISASASGYRTVSTVLNITNFKILHVLDSEDSEKPINPSLLKGNDNSFYGTTFTGGKYNLGSIFKITPAGKYTLLYSFNSNEVWPSSTLTQDDQGNLLGTTCLGGVYNDGSIFKLTPAGDLIILASFQAGVTGDCPQGSLVNNNGALYGVTLDNNGTIFQFTFNSGILKNIYTFTGNTDGNFPDSGLTLGPDGFYYGTTTYGGAYGSGTVFKINSAGNLQTLFSFNGNDGAQPRGSLILANNNYFYGTTVLDSAAIGSVYSFPASGEMEATFTHLDGSNGAWPYAGLLQTKSGNFYGTASLGGASNFGSIFQFTPSADNLTPGQITILYSFDGVSACNPKASLVEDDSGNLYGTVGGCADSLPSIFGFSPPASSTSAGQGHN